MKFVSVNWTNPITKKLVNEGVDSKLLCPYSFPNVNEASGPKPLDRKMSAAVIQSQSNRSSISSGSELKFKTIIKIKKLDGENKNVYFKQDGGRFNSTETIKLQAGVDYVVQLEVSPPLELTLIKLIGIDYNFKLISNPENDSKFVYEFYWSTNGIDPTLNRHRSDVPCVIKFKGYREMDFKLQIKFYPKNDTKHIVWGQQLNSITMECSVSRGACGSFVDSTKFV